MKLNSIQVAGLKSLAAVPVRAEPLTVVEDPKLQPAARAAYNLGKVDGRAELARELLQAEADRTSRHPKGCHCAPGVRAGVGTDAGGACLACGGVA